MKDTRTMLMANCKMQIESAICPQQFALLEQVLVGWDATWQTTDF
jgi:hypothetical protein